MAGVFHVRADKTLVEMQPAAFVTEDEFQDLLARFPRLLGDAPNGEPRRWLSLNKPDTSAPSVQGGGRAYSSYLYLGSDGTPLIVTACFAGRSQNVAEAVGTLVQRASTLAFQWSLEDLFDSLLFSNGPSTDGEASSAFGGCSPLVLRQLAAVARTRIEKGEIVCVLVTDQPHVSIAPLLHHVARFTPSIELRCIVLRPPADADCRVLITEPVQLVGDRNGDTGETLRNTVSDTTAIYSRLFEAQSSPTVRALESIIAWANERSLLIERVGNGNSATLSVSLRVQNRRKPVELFRLSTWTYARIELGSLPQPENRVHGALARLGFEQAVDQRKRPVLRSKLSAIAAGEVATFLSILDEMVAAES